MTQSTQQYHQKSLFHRNYCVFVLANRKQHAHGWRVWTEGAMRRSGHQAHWQSPVSGDLLHQG